MCLGIQGAALSITVAGTWLARKHFRKSPPHLDAPFALYPVSILKPLKGTDPGLAENLVSFFELDYPFFELIFCVADAFDPAIPLIEGLLRRYPGVRARLLVGDLKVGANPKCNNLARAYRSASHDWLLVSDSNVRVAPDFLKRVVANLEPGVGLVTAVVAGHEGTGLGGQLEMAFLNTFYARAMVLADGAGHPTTVGKSMLFQRPTADRFGGMEALARYLAEDYMAGEAMRRLGLRVVTMCDPVTQIIGPKTLSEFWARHVRWGRIRKSQAPLLFAVETLFGSVVSGLLGAFALAHAAGVAPALALAAHLCIWAGCDWLVLRSMRARPGVAFGAVWFARELAAVPMWLNIAAGNTVMWRGQRLTVLPGGMLEEN